MPVVLVKDGVVTTRWSNGSMEKLRAELGEKAELYEADVLAGFIHQGDGVFSAPQPEKPEITAQDVRAHAEMLIEQGTTIGALQFRCDDKSMRRLNALLRGFDRGAIGEDGKTYETAAGIPVTFKTRQEVEAVLNAAEDFESAILERSAELQHLNPIRDPAQEKLWDTSRPLQEILAELS